MSFISIYARENFLNVVTDGQVTGENGEVLDNHFKKYKKIGEHQFMAVAGNKGVADQAMETVPYLKEGYSLEMLAAKLHELALTVPDDIATILLAVGGVNEKKEIMVLSFSNQSSKKEVFRPKGDEIAYTFLCGKHSPPNEVLEEKLISFLRKTGYNTPNKAIRAQNFLNSYISEIDPTVNKITFEFTIKNGD